MRLPHNWPSTQAGSPELEINQLRGLADALGYLQGDDEPFFILTDGDGEQIAFGTQHVLVIDCSAEVEEEGHREIMRECGIEEDGTPEADEVDEE